MKHAWRIWAKSIGDKNGQTMSSKHYNYKNSDNTRWHFYESWLQEMPQRFIKRYDFPALLSELQDFLTRNKEQKINKSLYMAESEMFLYVYGNVDNEISIITYMEKSPQAVKILNTQKNEVFKKISPSATDLYLAALAVVQPRSLMFTSDNKMTDRGLSIWKKLLKMGKHISVYDVGDKSRSGKTLIPIPNDQPEKLDQYFRDDLTGQHYRYVLSESTYNFNNYVYDRFMMRRICESAGTIDDDNYKDEDK